VTAIAD
jgi:hypothetical protein